MPLRLQQPAVAVLCLVLGACSSIRSLDEDPLPLSASEKAHVGTQVDKALEKRRWETAWNQAVDAGADRGRLETIALGALQDDDGAAEDMLEALVGKWGGLTPTARGRVQALVKAALVEDDWGRAVEIEILAAEDAPTYQAAWDLYSGAPPRRAESLLEAITGARGDAEKTD